MNTHITVKELYIELDKIEIKHLGFFSKENKKLFDYIAIDINEDRTFNYFFREELELVKSDLDILKNKIIIIE